MKSSGNAKKTAFCAVFAAAIVAILTVGSLIDVLDFSLALIAGTVVMIVDLEFSEGYAWSVFTVSALLSFLLPVRSAPLFYTLFFGWYPLFRKHIRNLSRFLRILIKAVLLNALTTAMLFASVYLFGAEREPLWMILVTFLLANLVMLLYDPALDRLSAFYLFHLRDRLGFHR